MDCLAKLTKISSATLSALLLCGCMMSGGIEFAPSSSTSVPVLKAASVLEGDQLVIAWDFEKPAEKAFTIDWVLTGSGVNGDFSTQSGSIPVLVGQTSFDKQIAVLNNAIYQGDRSYTLTLSSTSLPATLSYPVTVREDETKSVVRFVSANQSINEGVANHSVQIEVVPANASSIEVDYVITGTAATLLDFSGVTSSRLTIPAGATNASIDFLVVDDALSEPSETVLVELTQIASGSAELGTMKLHTATIIDNEAVNLTVSDATVSEGGVATFTATLSTASASPVSFSWATADGTGNATTTYHAGSGIIVIPPLSTTATFTVNTRDNSTVCEAVKTFSVSLSAVSGATLVDGVGDATVTDPDRPQVSFITASSHVDEGLPASIPVALSEVCALHSVTVGYATQNGTATSPSDYTAAPPGAQLTIAAGQVAGTINVSTSPSPVGETFSVVLSSPSNATLGSITSHEVTIDKAIPLDLPTVSIADISLAEGSGGLITVATLTVTLSKISTLPVVLNFASSDGTATLANSDYLARSDTLTIPAGQTAGTIEVDVRRDLNLETDEVFYVTLSGGSGYEATGSDLSATITITDDDNPPLVSFSVASQSVSESQSFTIVATLSRTSNQTVTVTASLSGTATHSFNIGDSVDVVGGDGDHVFTFPAGALSATKTYSALHCGGPESNEEFILTISGISNGSAGASNQSHTVTIVDDPADDNSCGNAVSLPPTPPPEI